MSKDLLRVALWRGNKLLRSRTSSRMSMVVNAEEFEFGVSGGWAAAENDDALSV
jgi:hypothetical protein